MKSVLFLTFSEPATAPTPWDPTDRSGMSPLNSYTGDENDPSPAAVKCSTPESGACGTVKLVSDSTGIRSPCASNAYVPSHFISALGRLAEPEREPAVGVDRRALAGRDRSAPHRDELVLDHDVAGRPAPAHAPRAHLVAQKAAFDTRLGERAGHLAGELSEAA